MSLISILVTDTDTTLNKIILMVDLMFISVAKAVKKMLYTLAVTPAEGTQSCHSQLSSRYFDLDKLQRIWVFKIVH